MKMTDLSLVIPCFNEEEVIPLFYEESQKVINELKTQKIIRDAEYIFVDDGSKDKTLEIVKSLSEKDSTVHYISFSRNFGKEAAMYAGLKAAKGSFVTIMDADLQDPPSLLPQMLDAIKNEGFDSVATRRSSRKGEPVLRSFFARRFYSLMNKICRTELVSGARDYRLMNRKVVNAILSMSEYNRFSKGLFGWVGFKTKWISFENVERAAGKTKWSFWKLFKYAVEGIVAFTEKPLIASAVAGVLSTFAAVAALLFIIVRRLVFGDPVQGWASTICIILFIGGLQMFFTGILGEYLAKTYLEVKKRPVFICRESDIEEIENPEGEKNGK